MPPAPRMNNREFQQEMDRKFEEIKRLMLPENRPKWVGQMQFASVIWSKGWLYICREEYVGGSRILIWPLEEIPMDVEAIRLGRASIAALDGYVLGDRIVYADEKRELGKQLLHFFGYKSIPEFHRKTIGIGIRREKRILGSCLRLVLEIVGMNHNPAQATPKV